MAPPPLDDNSAILDGHEGTAVKLSLQLTQLGKLRELFLRFVNMET